MNILTEPWPHVIIEDFLPEDKFAELNELALEKVTDTELKPWLDYDPYEGHHDFMQYLEVMPHRPYKSLKKLVHFALTPANTLYHLHCDTEIKILSAILYLGPRENNGTGLYRANSLDAYAKMSMWLPNRMFIFCGMDGVTWHNFSANHNDRYTLNWFLINGEADRPDLIAL